MQIIAWAPLQCSLCRFHPPVRYAMASRSASASSSSVTRLRGRGRGRGGGHASQGAYRPASRPPPPAAASYARIYGGLPLPTLSHHPDQEPEDWNDDFCTVCKTGGEVRGSANRLPFGAFPRSPSSPSFPSPRSTAPLPSPLAGGGVLSSDLIDAQVVCCDGTCLRSFHTGCLDPCNVPPPPSSAASLWYCPLCQDGWSECADCKTLGRAEVELFKCSVPSCGRSQLLLSLPIPFHPF